MERSGADLVGKSMGGGGGARRLFSGVTHGFWNQFGCCRRSATILSREGVF